MDIVKITFEELLTCPNGMSIEEWHKVIEKRKRLRNKIRKLWEEHYDLLDGLEVLEDERGSERWQKKSDRLTKVNSEIKKYEAKLKEMT